MMKQQTGLPDAEWLACGASGEWLACGASNEWLALGDVDWLARGHQPDIDRM
jgi:hypothetical protein